MGPSLLPRSHSCVSAFITKFCRRYLHNISLSRKIKNFEFLTGYHVKYVGDLQLEMELTSTIADLSFQIPPGIYVCLS